MDDDAMCVCGHQADEHHRSWFRGGGELIEECEYYATNEAGGMKQSEVDGKWHEHCFRFQLKENGGELDG